MIPFFDFRPERERLRDALAAAIERVLASGQLILGPEVEAFEREFAAFAGATFAVGVNSGSDALTLALRACKIGHGDEVITTSNSGVPTVSAIRATGAIPRFVDVDEESLLMDTSALESARTSATRAVVPVHLYGRPVDLAPVMHFAQAHKLRVIEDCAQAHGAIYGGKHVGTWGDLGCFSFYPTKNLGAYGDGGLVVTENEALAASIREQRMYGFRDSPYAHVEGLNSRLDELQAAILRVKLLSLQQSIEHRRKIAARYRDLLAGSPARLHSSSDPTVHAGHAYHLFVISVADRDRVRKALADSGVMTGVHYPFPVHSMDAYRNLPVPPPLPVTEAACGSVLSLPLYNDMPPDTPERVANELLRILGA